jgi:CRP/FNR family transcriptional regulator, cyclic AMP receptor protein
VSVVRSNSAGFVRVLLEDPDLAEAVAPDRRDRAIDECTAQELRLPAGSWDAGRAAKLDSGIGLLVLEGLLVRRVGLDGRYSAELLGEGDVLRPWQEENERHSMLALTSGWTVVGPTRTALLDERASQHLMRYPALAERLFARAIDRARHLAVQLAIVHQSRVDVRLQMLFWHFAARWGRVRSDGTAIPLRLTHAVLADLVGARRPTVTSALSDLARRGVVRFVDDVWLLAGEPPGELAAFSKA